MVMMSMMSRMVKVYLNIGLRMVNKVNTYGGLVMVLLVSYLRLPWFIMVI